MLELELHFLFPLFSGDYFLSHSLSCTSNKENAVGGGGVAGSVLRLHHHGHGHIAGAIGGNRLSASRVWTPEDPRGANGSGGGGTSPSTTRTKRAA